MLAAKLKDQDDVQVGRALRQLWTRFTELLDALHDALADTPVTPQQLSDLMTAVLRDAAESSVFLCGWILEVRFEGST